MLENILNSSTNNINGPQMAVYANQWRFRSTKGIIHNGDFYFNKGSLDRNELVKQLIDVLACYEMVGINIYGIVSDGGGSDTKIFNTIADDKTLNVKWIIDGQ